MGKISSPQELEQYRNGVLSKRDPHQPCVTVCGGTGCHASGCHQVIDAFRKVFRDHSKGNGVQYSCHRLPRFL